MPRKQKTPPKPESKSAYKTPLKLLFFVGTFLFLATFFDSSAPSQNKTYSEIKGAIKAGNVKNLWISPELVGVELLEPKNTRWVAENVENDPTLIPLLEEKNVPYESKAQANWLKDFFLSWILPIVFLLLISLIKKV